MSQLTFSYGEAAWSYKGFERFQNKVYASMNMPSSTMEEAYETGELIDIDGHPLLPLLEHSVCDGVLTVDEMRQMLPVLKRLISRWKDNDPDKQNGLDLIAGMKKAVQEGEDLRFL